MRFKRATLMLLSALLSVSAVKPYSPPAVLAQSAAAAPVSARPVHWGYDGDLGPAKWSRLSPAYAACAGRQQSPIDLSDPALQATSPWKVNYKTTGLTLSHHEHVTDILDNGHTIQVSVEGGSTLVTARDIYELKQFHFHTPSEHTLHGKSQPLEAHFVHQSASGRFAVIAVLFVEGRSNPNLAMLIANFPSARGDTRFVPGVQLDLALHLPKDNVAYSYLGSFTTPPCTENVEWLVFRDPVAASAAQLSAFADRLHHNNRPVQPTRQRPIRTGSVVGTMGQP